MQEITLIPLLFMLPILGCTAYCDLRHLRIPNALSLGAVALFVATAPLLGWTELALRVADASVVFVLGFAAFALRLFGGGDVKMMAALMLFIPSQTLTIFALGFSASLIVGIVFVLLVRMAPRRAFAGWTGLTEIGKFPMGISIAIAGCIHPLAVFALS